LVLVIGFARSLIMTNGEAQSGHLGCILGRLHAFQAIFQFWMIIGQTPHFHPLPWAYKLLCSTCE
jgi:hypothetical protein